MVEELREIGASLPVDNKNDLSDSIKQIKDGVVEENMEKKESLFRKGLGGIKDFLVDKGFDLLDKYLALTALFTGASAM